MRLLAQAAAEETAAQPLTSTTQTAPWAWVASGAYHPGPLTVMCSTAAGIAAAAASLARLVRVVDHATRTVRIYDQADGRMLMEVTEADLAAASTPNLATGATPADEPPVRRAIALGGIDKAPR